MLSIPEFFSNKNVLITGGSGFVGKALIDKLLRSCPDIGNIYMLIRSRKGVNPQERVKRIIDNPLFDLIRDKNPSYLKKVIAIPGNTQELKLGLSEEDEKFLTTQVHIIYHCAAHVNFDVPLKSAIMTNIRGARELSNLAIRCENLQVLVHVSTMYSNCDEDVIDEKVYPPNVDWRDLVELAEDDSLTINLEVLSLKFIHPFPNTYTYSKKISETVFRELCKDKIPLVICRPSIIIHALSEPIPCWIDNLNGPFSLLLGSLKGIIDIHYGDGETYLDKVFIDNVIKAIIMASWKKCMDSDNTKELTVCNICSDVPWKIKYYYDIQDECLEKLPMENRFSWGGTSRVTKCWYYYYFHLIVFNLIPALFGDLLLKLTGKRTMLFRYQRKIYIASTCLLYFIRRTFIFKNECYVTLENNIMDCDKPSFAFREYIPKDVKKSAYLIASSSVIGMKKFVLQEKYPVAPETFANTKKFYILHLVIVWLRYIVMGYFLFWKWNLHLIICDKMYNYVDSL